MRRTAMCGVLAVSGIAGAAMADVVLVDGQAAIFDAGRAETTLDGVLPPVIEIPAGAVSMYVPEVTGLVRANPNLQWAGPDGNTTTRNDTDINSYNSISGLIHPRTMALLGVFLTDNEPEGQAPSRLDYYQIGDTFESFSPVLRQSFFIGDGWADGETMHEFMIPAGATRLYLGMADAGYFTGDPSEGGGAYDDNSGSFAADIRFNVVPAPGAVALLGLGGLVGVRRKR